MASYLTTSDKQFSIHVSRTLDCLGKSQGMVKYRVKKHRQKQRHYTILSPTNVIIAGSKGEGLTTIYESDYDNMFVFPDVICADNARHYTNFRNITVFQTERHETPAGYTKLKLVQFEGNTFIPLFHNSLIRDENMDIYMSSDCFITYAGQVLKENHRNFIHHERSGPSLPASCDASNFHMDVVWAFYCVCPDLLRAFINRPRLYYRPTRSILDDISNMDAHEVPVGCKESDTSNLEWRICFTNAEIHLIHNLNDIETKLYVVLKMIAKILQQISYDITSYVMKNIVLWMVELYPADMFTEELLTAQLIQALIFLKKCVDSDYLLSYMIPDRNLLAGRFDSLQRRKLSSFLSTLIQEGGNLLSRCKKLQVAMVILYREPDIAQEFRLRRDMVEKLDLIRIFMGLDKQATTGLTVEQVFQLLTTDRIYNIIIGALLHVTVPEWLVLALQGDSPEDIAALCRERFELMLS